MSEAATLIKFDGKARFDNVAGAGYSGNNDRVAAAFNQTFDIEIATLGLNTRIPGLSEVQEIMGSQSFSGRSAGSGGLAV